MRLEAILLALILAPLSGCAADGQRREPEVARWPAGSAREVTADFDGDRRDDRAWLRIEGPGRLEVWFELANGRGGMLESSGPDAGQAALRVLPAGPEPTCPPHPTRTCTARSQAISHYPFLLVTRPDGGQHLWMWSDAGMFFRREVFP